MPPYPSLTPALFLPPFLPPSLSVSFLPLALSYKPNLDEQPTLKEYKNKHLLVKIVARYLHDVGKRKAKNNI